LFFGQQVCRLRLFFHPNIQAMPCRAAKACAVSLPAPLAMIVKGLSEAAQKKKRSKNCAFPGREAI
jgi:hypothetical protein